MKLYAQSRSFDNIQALTTSDDFTLVGRFFILTIYQIRSECKNREI